MIPRPNVLNTLRIALERSRVVALIGPRQCGKTTLARQFVPIDSLNYFDLEDPISLARLDQPMTALRDLKGLVIIDEIQRRPELLPIIRVLVDRELSEASSSSQPAHFLILGSASPDLQRASAESLAGRVETISMSGFSLSEVGVEALPQHWLRGGFPLSFLAASENDSLVWRKNFIQTFLERDLAQWGVRVPATTMLRFWTMLAHYHGQIWNAAEPARSLGVSEPTIRHYLDVLEGVLMMRVLQPWHANLNKRQVKAPKIYFRDPGILHYLSGIRSEVELLTHPKSGASWEGYVVEEVLKALSPDESYFWATHNGAELDLMILKNGQRLGVECKRLDAPRLTPSMRIAMDDLHLEHLVVIYPGDRPYPLADHITAVPLAMLGEPDLVGFYELVGWR